MNHTCFLFATRQIHPVITCKSQLLLLLFLAVLIGQDFFAIYRLTYTLKTTHPQNLRLLSADIWARLIYCPSPIVIAQVNQCQLQDFTCVKTEGEAIFCVCVCRFLIQVSTYQELNSIVAYSPVCPLFDEAICLCSSQKIHLCICLYPLKKLFS